eukprot:m.43481 g.43481  ORF g.43481 m.43481 type:complete len:326 (+) comp12223_c0_seq4:2746-3723(+)
MGDPTPSVPSKNLLDGVGGPAVLRQMARLLAALAGLATSRVGWLAVPPARLSSSATIGAPEAAAMAAAMAAAAMIVAAAVVAPAAAMAMLVAFFLPEALGVARFRRPRCCGGRRRCRCWSRGRLDVANHLDEAGGHHNGVVQRGRLFNAHLQRNGVGKLADEVVEDSRVAQRRESGRILLHGRHPGLDVGVLGSNHFGERGGALVANVDTLADLVHGCVEGLRTARHVEDLLEDAVRQLVAALAENPPDGRRGIKLDVVRHKPQLHLALKHDEILRRAVKRRRLPASRGRSRVGSVPRRVRCMRGRAGGSRRRRRRSRCSADRCS